MLKKLLTITGSILIVGTIIALIWSAPNYMEGSTGKLSYTLFLIFGLLLESAKTFGLGLLCLYAGKRLDS